MESKIEIVEANISILICDMDMLVKEVREIHTCMKGMECMLQELAGGKKEMPSFRRAGTCSSGVVLGTPDDVNTLKSNIYNSTEPTSREYVGCVPQDDVMK